MRNYKRKPKKRSPKRRLCGVPYPFSNPRRRMIPDYQLKATIWCVLFCLSAAYNIMQALQLAIK